MVARDIMDPDVFTVAEDARLAEVSDELVARRLTGAPVVDDDGDLVGIVTQEDVYLGASTVPQGCARFGGPRVRDVMTAPAVCAREDTDVAELCRLMAGLRVNRIPIVRGRRVTGVVTSIDVCRAVFDGRIGVPAGAGIAGGVRLG